MSAQFASPLLSLPLFSDAQDSGVSLSSQYGEELKKRLAAVGKRLRRIDTGITVDVAASEYNVHGVFSRLTASSSDEYREGVPLVTSRAGIEVEHVVLFRLLPKSSYIIEATVSEVRRAKPRPVPPVL